MSWKTAVQWLKKIGMGYDMKSRSGDSASSPSVKSSPDLASDISSAVPPF